MNGKQKMHWLEQQLPHCCPQGSNFRKLLHMQVKVVLLDPGNGCVESWMIRLRSQRSNFSTAAGLRWGGLFCRS
jgi:hypothetical protein